MKKFLESSWAFFLILGVIGVLAVLAVYFLLIPRTPSDPFPSIEEGEDVVESVARETIRAIDPEWQGDLQSYVSGSCDLSRGLSVWVSESAPLPTERRKGLLPTRSRDSGRPVAWPSTSGAP